MEQDPLTRGDTSTTNTNQEQPDCPPLTFAEAEQHNPYALLIELHDHALAAPGREHAAHHLAELALSAAVVSWWSRWQSLTMHQALLAGATQTEVAAATGLTETEVYERWNRWANGQSDLFASSGLGVDPLELGDIRARIVPPPGDSSPTQPPAQSP